MPSVNRETYTADTQSGTFAANHNAKWYLNTVYLVPSWNFIATPTIPSILASIYLQWLFIKQPCLMCVDGMLTAYTHAPTNQVPCSTLPLHLHFVFTLFTLFPVWEQWTSNQSKWSSSLRLLILCVILAYPFLGIGQGWAHIKITYAVPKLSIRLDSRAASCLFSHISVAHICSARQQPAHTQGPKLTLLLVFIVRDWPTSIQNGK